MRPETKESYIAIVSYARKNPHLSHTELGKVFNMSASGIAKALHSMGYIPPRRMSRYERMLRSIGPGEFKLFTDVRANKLRETVEEWALPLFVAAYNGTVIVGNYQGLDK